MKRTRDDPVAFNIDNSVSHVLQTVDPAAIADFDPVYEPSAREHVWRLRAASVQSKRAALTRRLGFATTEMNGRLTTVRSRQPTPSCGSGTCSAGARSL